MDMPVDPREIDLNNVPAVAAGMAVKSGHGVIDRGALATRLRARLEAGDDDAIRQALTWKGPPELCQALWEGLQQALEPGGEEDGLRLQWFALPIVVVAGARQPARIGMTLGEVGTITALFQAAGALGPNQQFGLNAGLCGERAFGCLPWSALYQRGTLRSADAAPVDLSAEDLDLTAGQSVHLRFLVGSLLVPAGAPGFRETAGDVGRWGADLTRELARQLAAPGVTLLPLARTPQGLVAAWQLGRFCVEEVAFQLAVGDSLRDMRSREGDPRVSMQSIPGTGLGVALESLWTGERVVHPWRLHPETSLAEVVSALQAFLRDCGLPVPRPQGTSQ